MNTITINNQEFTEHEIMQVLEMSRELLSINEDLNAKCIAMNAKLENEETKVMLLQHRLAQLNTMFTNKTYEG